MCLYNSWPGDGRSSAGRAPVIVWSNNHCYTMLYIIVVILLRALYVIVVICVMYSRCYFSLQSLLFY